jgi:hypothetical protein
VAGGKQTLVVDAEPTKDLFIEMLVRDIDLRAAILDLVDNSIDGARAVVAEKGGKSAPSKTPLRKMFLRIETSATSLALTDNCGGISLTDARKYAFRFGAHKKKNIENSIGQFGVGMKRAFFKLGSKFEVVSTTRESRFVLPVDVQKWSRSKKWEFVLKEVDESRQPAKAVGTAIRIEPLLPAVSEEIGAPGFSTGLLDQIVASHQEAINEGFELTVDGIVAAKMPAVLLRSSEIAPANTEFDVNGAGAPVRVRLVCGVGESRPGEAGWDVLCNGRTVLKSDQTPVTGWGGSADQRLPSYHNQFARFRGFAYFDCRDASRVPWTTTKNGLDRDSPVWRSARQRMISMMRPVIDFLNELDSEHDREGSAQTGATLASKVGTARPVAVADLSSRGVFLYPKATKAPRVGNVNYSRSREELARAKRALGVSSYREVGERTFEYWVKAELD